MRKSDYLKLAQIIGRQKNAADELARLGVNDWQAALNMRRL